MPSAAVQVDPKNDNQNLVSKDLGSVELKVSCRGSQRNPLYLRPTCPCADAERVKAGVKRLRQSQFHFEGLASPHDQLLLRDLTGVVFGVVAFALDVRLQKD